MGASYGQADVSLTVDGKVIERIDDATIFVNVVPSDDETLSKVISQLLDQGGDRLAAAIKQLILLRAECRASRALDPRNDADYVCQTEALRAARKATNDAGLAP